MPIESWEYFNDYLDNLTLRMGAVAYSLTDSTYREFIRPIDLPKYEERKKDCIELLENRFGKNFLRKGRGKRFLHNEKNNLFIAEQLLSTYLLIIFFKKPFNLFKCSSILDKEKEVINDVLGRLPPLGGGGGTSGANKARA
jgi:hypothetical protein